MRRWLRYYRFARRMGQPRRRAWRDAFFYCDCDDRERGWPKP